MTTPDNRQEAKSRLLKIFDKRILDGERATISESYALAELCDLETLFELMREVDPERKFFKPPQMSFRGLFGLPLADAHIAYSSSTKTTKTSYADDRIPVEFSDAVQNGFDTGELSGCGCLIWHESENTHGFLVILPIGSLVEPVQADMDDLSARLGCKVAAYSDPSYCEDARIILTAFILNIEALSSARTVFDELENLAKNWGLQPQK